MVPAVVVGRLMLVVVAMAAEVDVRAAPMIGSWAVRRVVHMRHRRRSNHEMRDKQERRQETNPSHAFDDRCGAVSAATPAAAKVSAAAPQVIQPRCRSQRLSRCTASP